MLLWMDLLPCRGCGAAVDGSVSLEVCGAAVVGSVSL